MAAEGPGDPRRRGSDEESLEGYLIRTIHARGKPSMRQKEVAEGKTPGERASAR